MAYDKVIDSAVLDANLTSVADAIRAKGGTTEALSFPDGFVSALEGIQVGGGGLTYDMGEFIPTSDTTEPTFSHNLGVIPDFVFVWTEEFAGTTNEYGNNTVLGCIAINNPFGLNQRYTSTASGYGVGAQFLQGSTSDIMQVSAPVAGAYNPGEMFARTDNTAEKVRLVRAGSSHYYRAGKVYKYLVAKAWWNVGGAANAE